MVVELDGSQHFTPEGITHDESRTAAMATYGVEVLRFNNQEIDSAFKAVCAQIDRAVYERFNRKKEE